MLYCALHVYSSILIKASIFFEFGGCLLLPSHDIRWWTHRPPPLDTDTPYGGVTPMMTHPWTRSFPLSEDDVDSLVNLLLERETPMTTEQLALILMEQRLQAERDALEARYRDTQLYNPAHAYKDG